MLLKQKYAQGTKFFTLRVNWASKLNSNENVNNGTIIFGQVSIIQTKSVSFTDQKQRFKSEKSSLQ